MSELVGFLESLPAFRELTPEELRSLDRAILITEFPDGHPFTTQGKRADDLAILLAGEVEVSRLGAISSRHRTVRTLGGGDLCGLQSMVDGLAEETTCTARGPVLAATLSRAVCALLINQSASIAFHFQLLIGTSLARDLAERNRAMRALLAEL